MLRSAAIGFAAAILAPVLAAAATPFVFEGTSWTVEGRIRTTGLGRRLVSHATFHLDFPGSGVFRVDDSSELVLTGTHAPSGRRGNAVTGALDRASEIAFETLVESLGLPPDSMSIPFNRFTARVGRGGTRLRMTLQFRIEVYDSSSGRTLRLRQTSTGTGVPN